MYVELFPISNLVVDDTSILPSFVASPTDSFPVFIVPPRLFIPVLPAPNIPDDSLFPTVIFPLLVIVFELLEIA